jgi:hypothetical protein
MLAVAEADVGKTLLAVRVLVVLVVAEQDQKAQALMVAMEPLVLAAVAVVLAVTEHITLQALLPQVAEAALAS